VVDGRGQTSGGDNVLAYDYPVLGVFWSILVIFLWIMWFFLLFRVIGDIFRSDDLSGWGKAAWLIFVLVVPFLGVFVYVIARGDEMGKRDVAQARAQNQAFQDYVRDAAGTGGSADQLAKLADLRDRGVINDAEFEQQKAKLLS
jgi:Short C-terminal domain/Phospholipase_D-nuclease N-terminal